VAVQAGAKDALKAHIKIVAVDQGVHANGQVRNCLIAATKGKPDFPRRMTASEFLASVADGRFRRNQKSAFDFPPGFMWFP